MDYNLILFDCDGTLVDTEPLQNLACAQILNEEGLLEFTPASVAQRFIGTRFSEMLKIIAAETGHVFSDTMSKRYVDRVRELAPMHFRKIEGVQAMVAQARESCKIAVVSNGQRDNIFLSLDMAGLRNFFSDECVLSGLMAVAKPAPDLFLLAAKTFGEVPEKCLVIEDSVPGVTAGHAASMDVIGFTGAHGGLPEYGERLRQAGAGRVYNSFIHMRRDLFA